MYTDAEHRLAQWSWCCQRLVAWCLGRWISIKKSIRRPVRRLHVLGLAASTDLQAFVVPTADESPKMARHLDGARGLLTTLNANGMVDFYELGRFAGRVMSMSAAMPRVRLHLTAVYCVLTNRSLASSPAVPDCRPWWTRGASSGARLVRLSLVTPLIKSVEVILGLLASGRVFPWKTQRHMWVWAWTGSGRV